MLSQSHFICTIKKTFHRVLHPYHHWKKWKERILLKIYLKKSSGVIQVGAHNGQELPLFVKKGVQDLILFEPIKGTFEELSKNVESYYKNFNIRCVNKALGAEKKTCTIYLSSNDN